MGIPTSGEDSICEAGLRIGLARLKLGRTPQSQGRVANRIVRIRFVTRSLNAANKREFGTLIRFPQMELFCGLIRFLAKWSQFATDKVSTVCLPVMNRMTIACSSDLLKLQMGI